MSYFNRFIVLFSFLLIITSCGFLDTTDAEKETTKSEDSLTAPSNLKAEIGSGIYGGDVNLSWDSVSVASKYNIYRSVNDDKYFQFLEYTYFTSSYDTNVEAGKAYYYKLTSVNLDIESDFSNIVSVSIPNASFKLSDEKFELTSLNFLKVTGIVESTGNCVANFVKVTYTMYKNDIIVDTNFTYPLSMEDFPIGSKAAYSITFYDLNSLDAYDRYETKVTFTNVYE
ncbi:MAG: hypothetical protein A2015_10105 [Spirochaetes bacterium GWF1_31_7]|nr:MAG: hypothetical protein A2Y30_10110 [Spirochaetes bacterium GWE1_32_154]OHD51608.1 MAG: hypothetical protein A2015_10105 [Spirochaetes bacterium GWF1_31_7]OHD52165.1 MAG: hypothetical protein A2Y29_16980 [Spirochaetes bacterium GWE2_31_10]OHD79732.1 MAG: hypothetical protein A2355_18170 [Spirochaetes bacterium RIFOXYB1_FULL_32_8]HBD94212.1 hypothetical protein [Spirochaetia bacterium]